MPNPLRIVLDGEGSRVVRDGRGSGGCAISSFVVEYKYRGKATSSGDGGGFGGDSSWVLVNNNVKVLD